MTNRKQQIAAAKRVILDSLYDRKYEGKLTDADKEALETAYRLLEEDEKNV